MSYYRDKEYRNIDNVCVIRELLLEFKFSIDLFPKRCDKVEVSAWYRLELGGALKSLQNLLTRLRPMHVEQNIPDSRHQLGGKIRSIAHELPRKWNRHSQRREKTVHVKIYLSRLHKRGHRMDARRDDNLSFVDSISPQLPCEIAREGREFFGFRDWVYT